jgi:amidase
MPTFTGPELCRKTACYVVDLLRTRRVSPRELLEAAFARIEEVEPAVNAMPTLCRERAFAAAQNVSGDSAHPGWLAGLPIAIKDLTSVAGVRTSYGTRGLAEHVPEISDPLVTRLEERGGIVVGKTNTPEFGAGANTFNEVFGATLNPWDTRLNAGGSSGGAAVSLATGEVWMSHGSDHGGSLRTPAAYNGVVGLRPSFGRVPTGSDAPYILEPQEGPMARTVEDCALFLDAMAGFDPSVPTSYAAPETPFRSAVQRASGKVRIGFASDLGGLCPVEPEMDRYLRRGLLAVERCGGTVDDIAPDVGTLDRTYHVLRGLLWVAVSKNVPRDVSIHFKDVIRQNTEFGRTLTAEDIAQAQLERTRIYREMYPLFDSFDALALPVVGNMPRAQSEEWVRDVNGTMFSNYMDWLRFSFLATVTGLPAISVPVGLSDDRIPVGLQLIGPPRGEAQLLAVARAVEAAVGGPLSPIDPVVHSSRQLPSERDQERRGGETLAQI